MLQVRRKWWLRGSKSIKVAYLNRAWLAGALGLDWTGLDGSGLGFKVALWLSRDGARDWKEDE